MNYKRVLQTVVTLSLGSTLLAGCGQGQTTKPQNTTNQVSTTHQQQNPNLKSAVAYIKSQKTGASVSGAASLTVDKKSHQLTVVVELSGLTPKNKYTLRISDEAGVKVYDLKDVQADTKGSGISMTRIGKVDAISSTWTILISTDGNASVGSGKVQWQKSS